MYPELAGFAVDAACLSALGIADSVVVVVCFGVLLILLCCSCCCALLSCIPWYGTRGNDQYYSTGLSAVVPAVLYTLVRYS